MTRPNLPSTFARQQAVLQQQIDQVTRFSQLGNSTIKDGALVILDDNGAARILIGEYTFTSGPHSGATIYGLVVFDSSGQPIIVEGQLPGGGYGRAVYDDSGNLMTLDNAAGFTAGSVSLTSSGLQAGSVSLTSSGLQVLNGSTVEVLAGLLNASPAIYGLAVRNYAGVLQQVGGSVSLSGLAASNVTNTTWTNFAGTSVVTAEIGPSGQAIVSCGGSIATGIGGQQGIVGVSIDGATASGYGSVSSGAGGASATVGSTRTVTGLSAGTHTFQVQYETANNGASTCSFSVVGLTVQPL